MPPRNIDAAIQPPLDDPLSSDSPIASVITEETHSEKLLPLVIVWRNVAVFVVLHLAALYSLTLFHVVKGYTLLWTLFMYIVSALGITAGAHRLWSHRSYKATLPLRMILGILQTMAFQNDILEWCRDHRVHHKFSETDADPHNARRGFFFAHMGWLMVRKHPDVKNKGKVVDMSDLKADPVIRFQRKYYKTLVVLFSFVIPSFIPVILWGESLYNAFYLAGIFRLTLMYHGTWLVNSAAHMWGNRPYDCSVNFHENMGVSFAAIGEGFHNYHHTFPQDYSTSEYGWHLNLTSLFIDTCAFVGLASDRTKIPIDVVLRRKEKTGDGS